MAAAAIVNTAPTATIPPQRRDWRGAFAAMKKLLADADDTTQVFRIMAALNAGTAEKNYVRLLKTPEGGRLAYERVELVHKLTDAAWLAQFAPGTVGATYRAFLEKTGFSATGLADVSNEVHGERVIEHPYAWFGRRERDIHDIWHVLTGYQANDPLGELCLVAFSYAQSKGLGWGFIATMGVLSDIAKPHGTAVARAVWEGYRHGRTASWLHGEDIEKLFAEPIDAARARLKIATPAAYLKTKEVFGETASTAQPMASAA